MKVGQLKHLGCSIDWFDNDGKKVGFWIWLNDPFHFIITKFSFSFQTRSSLLKVDGVGNVLEEAPSKLAHSLLLFCKGLGWLTSVQLPGVDRRSSVDNRRSSLDSQVQKYTVCKVCDCDCSWTSLKRVFSLSWWTQMGEKPERFFNLIKRRSHWGKTIYNRTLKRLLFWKKIQDSKNFYNP